MFRVRGGELEKSPYVDTPVEDQAVLRLQQR